MDIPLYIHIPFCRKKCFYCDFYSIKYDAELAREYINTLIPQVKRLKDEGYRFSTVYIGGGTPSVLEPQLFECFLKSLGLSDSEEVTLEANPESLTEQKLKIACALGVNRLSIGVQSFDNNSLSFLGRVHNSAQAAKAVESAYKNGFKNISIDLIYGIPGQDISLWQRTLAKAVSLPVTHISFYSLTYEKGTLLSQRLRDKEFLPLSQEEEAKMYRYGVSFLESRGFYRYEISNFSLKGFECKHNLSYWANCPYQGIGAGAVSFLGGVRKKFLPDVRKYVSRVKGNSSRGLFVEEEKLPPLRHALETAVLNLRRKKGINLHEFTKNTGFDLLTVRREEINKLIKDKMVSFKKQKNRLSGIRLTNRGFLFYDYVCREFL